MARLTILIILFTMSQVMHAQRYFEGYVVYHGSEWYDDGADTLKASAHSIKVYFSPGKLRVESMRERKSSTDVGIILLDSGITYTPNDEDKTYVVERLKKKRLLPVPSRQHICGIASTPVVDDCFVSRMVDGDAVLWYADSLLFDVPAYYEGVDELIMVRQKHVLLKLVMYAPEYESSGREILERARLEAVEVKWGPNPAHLFRIPPGYTRAAKFDPYADDSVSVLVDSAVMDQQALWQLHIPVSEAGMPQGGATAAPRKAEIAMRKPADNH